MTFHRGSKVLINCKSSGNGRGGFYWGPGAKPEAVGCEAYDNAGPGFHIEGNVNFIEQLGLPQDTSPKELAGVLDALARFPAQERLARLLSSEFWKKVASGLVDATTVAANIVTLLSQPNLLAVIAHLAK